MLAPGRHVLGLVLAAASVAAPNVAGAIEEIIVTTQKREQALQDVPLAVSAYDERFLEQVDAKDFRDLVALTPGFKGGTDDGFIDALAIRGISTNDFGIGGDPSVAIFIDGVHEGRNGGAVTSFLDIERAEVVRGPQNTLFGRNAIAGAVSMVTHKPEELFGGKLSAAVEDYDHYELTGTLNAPLTDQLYFRVSAEHFQEDGYLDNLEGGEDLGEHDRDAGQAALRWLGDATDATLTAFLESREGDPSVYWSTYPLLADGSLNPDPDGPRLPEDKVSTDLGAAGQGRDESDIFKLTLNVDHDLGGDYSVTSITGFKTYDFFYREDYDATGVYTNNYQQDQDVDYISQELRLNSPQGRPIVWFAGASIYSEDIDATFENQYDEDQLCRSLGVTEEIGPVTGCDDPLFEAYWGSDVDPADIINDKAEVNTNKGEYWGWAAYADVTWSVTDRLDLIVGARYTWDEKKFTTNVLDSGGALGNNFVWGMFTDGPISDEKDWSGFTPRFAFNFDLNDQWAFYGNVANGYKSGGFSTFGVVCPDADSDPATNDCPEDGSLAPAGTVPKSFDEEKVWSYEIGTKARLLDDSLQANLSLYHFDFEDLQLTYFQSGSQLTDNVAETSANGAELEVHWTPGSRWDVLASLAYTDSEIDSVDPAFLGQVCTDCVGNELWFSPEWSTSEVLTYRIPLSSGAEVSVSGEHHYQDKMFAGPDNLELAATPSWNEFNFRLGYDSGASWSVIAYVLNAFDEEYFERGWENADATNLGGYGLVNSLVWPSKPRTVGLRANWKF
jgi:iron complex outermembrane receptor protein